MSIPNTDTQILCIPSTSVCQDLLFQVELVEYLHSALQDLIYIINTIRVAFHGQIDERNLKRDHVL